MFLAGKVEETPRPLKDVILVSYEIIHKKDPAAIQRIKQKVSSFLQPLYFFGRNLMMYCFHLCYHFLFFCIDHAGSV